MATSRWTTISPICAARCGDSDRALCIYASDAEIFDFRPGRYKTEEQCSGREWDMLAGALAALGREPLMRLIAPGAALGAAAHRAANQTLRLETAACPVPVKKQRKYNLSRWAVTGRDDLGVNAACERIYRGMADRDATDADWKELCYLWASDFRTHITEKRWAGFVARLTAAETKWRGAGTGASSRDARPGNRSRVTSRSKRRASSPASTAAAASPSRRCALRRMRPPTIGGLPHGHFDDIALQADWYTGDCVFEAPGEHKITDLEWCETTHQRGYRRWHKSSVDGSIRRADRSTRPCASMRSGRASSSISSSTGTIGVAAACAWATSPCCPMPSTGRPCRLTTHNGGREPETYPLHGATIEHGAPVSFLVSSSFGLGMTEGWAELGDARTRIRIEVDRTTAPLLGLLTHKRVGGSLFCQLMLSALELDETRKPHAYRERTAPLPLRHSSGLIARPGVRFSCREDGSSCRAYSRAACRTRRHPIRA